MHDPTQPDPRTNQATAERLNRAQEAIRENDRSFNVEILANLYHQLLQKTPLTGADMSAFTDAWSFAAAIGQGQVVPVLKEHWDTLKAEADRLAVYERRVEQLNAVLARPDIKAILDVEEALRLRQQANELMLQANKLADSAAWTSMLPKQPKVVKPAAESSTPE